METSLIAAVVVVAVLREAVEVALTVDVAVANDVAVIAPVGLQSVMLVRPAMLATHSDRRITPPRVHFVSRSKG